MVLGRKTLAPARMTLSGWRPNPPEAEKAGESEVRRRKFESEAKAKVEAEEMKWEDG